jgi:adenylyl-sulfate kinase
MKKASIFWFTGLSGSGKTTVATAAKNLLESHDCSVLILDGDDVREQIHVHLGFTEQDIKKNNSLIADLCRIYRNNYDVILVPIISPYDISRKQARDLLGDGFFEIYFSADLATVMNRDVKGLYAKAMRNEINNLIGYSPSNIFEPPQHPDFVVDSGCDNVEKSVEDLYKFIMEKKECKSV